MIADFFGNVKTPKLQVNTRDMGFLKPSGNMMIPVVLFFQLIIKFFDSFFLRISGADNITCDISPKLASLKKNMQSFNSLGIIRTIKQSWNRLSNIGFVYYNKQK